MPATPSSPVAPKSEAFGIEELTNILILINSTLKTVQKRMDAGNADAGALFADFLMLMPQINSVLRGFSGVSNELRDLSADEYTKLSRTYLDPILQPILLGLIHRIVPAA